MPRPCQRFLLVWSHSTGVESGKVHACKNQCESINQAESERLKKSRGNGVMCVIERGFLYLHRPPRLPSCQGKPAKAKIFCNPKQIVSQPCQLTLCAWGECALFKPLWWHL